MSLLPAGVGQGLRVTGRRRGGADRRRLPELRAAVASIERLASDFAPEQYTDEYQTALIALIAAKAQGAEMVWPTEARQDAAMTD